MNVKQTLRLLQDDIFGIWITHSMSLMGLCEPLPEGTNTEAIFSMMLDHFEYEKLSFKKLADGYRALRDLVSNADISRPVRLKADDALRCLDTLYFSTNQHGIQAIKKAIMN